LELHVVTPAVAAASTILGKIASPEEILKSKPAGQDGAKWEITAMRLCAS